MIAEPGGSEPDKREAGQEIRVLPERRKPRTFWTLFFRQKRGVAGLLLLGIFVIMAIFAPLVAPWGPYESDLNAPTAPPSAQHWLGTDRIGRDVWARMAYGARVSFSVALVAVGIYTTVGIALGGLAGYIGGLVDSVIMRFTDAVMCFPTFMLTISLAAIVPPSILNVMFVLGAFGWPGMCRLVRGQFLSIRNQDYVMAAEALGASRKRTIFRHILPNAVVPIVVSATLGLAGTIMAEAGLSFLGLGVREPMPSWGMLMTVAMQLPILEFYVWLWMPPAVAIALTVLAVNSVGDALTYAMDPRLRSRG